MQRLLAVAALLGVAFACFSFIDKPSAAISKRLVFPVAGKSHVGSVWGVPRDGGRRKHQGIDIFAKKGTPVVAIADGVITSSGNTTIGGKVLWLRPSGASWTAYYAHLDKQLVKEGAYVRKGQVIGTVGKTGNARTTPPHLHFGIYTWNGAINPLPVVKNSPRLKSPGVLKQQPETMLAKTQKATMKQPAIPTVAATKVTFPRQYIHKTLRLSADPSGECYVTTRSNVIRVQEGEYQVIGKWKRATNSKYPYQLAMNNNQKLYVNKAGRLLSGSGKQVGTVI